jgi:hypothetical protein
MPPEKLVRPEPPVKRFVRVDGDTMSATAAGLVKSGMTYIGGEVRRWVDEDGPRGTRRQVSYDALRHAPHQAQVELIEYLTVTDANGQTQIRMVRNHRDCGVIGFRLSAKCLRRCGLSTVGEKMLHEIETTEEAAVTR